MKFFISLLRPYWSRMLLVILLLSIEVSFYSFFTFSIQYIISFLMNKQADKLIHLFIFLFIGCLFAIASSVLRCFVYARLASDMLRDLRKKVYNVIQLFSIGELSSKASSKLQLRFHEVDLIGAALAIIDKNVIYSLLSFVASLTLLIFINIQLTMIALLLVPFLFLVPKIVVPKINVIDEERETEELLAAFEFENIFLQPIIRIFNLQNKQEALFDSKNAKSSLKYRHVQALNSLVSSSADIVPIMLRITVFLLGSYFVLMEGFQITALVSFEFVFSQLIYSLIRIFYSWPTVTLGYSALKSLRRFIGQETAPEVKEKIHQELANPRLILNDVSFCYQPESFVLSHLNLTIPFKSHIAFVGPNGAGKSTLMSLLLNFYSPTEGTIEINGINLESLPKEDLYGAIAYVPQDTLLFNTSIEENIRIGKPDATSDEIKLAARKTKLESEIELMPDKYDTIVGERGGRLSAGQKQRISIARALIRNPKILLLDETTASLDALSEAAINNTILEIAKECTVIVVAHRLSSVVNVDCIYVMDRGEICESGTHKQLFDKQGFYRKMWNKQHRLRTVSEETSKISKAKFGKKNHP